MNKKQNIIVVIVLICTIYLTIGFSAFVSKLSISNTVATVRVKEDVRITNVELIGEESNNVLSNELNFDKDSVLADVTFNGDDSYIVYKITLTNIGNIDACLYNLVLSDTNLNYELVDGNLRNPIDALGDTEEIVIKVKSSELNKTLKFNIECDLRRYYTLSYENLDNQSEQVIEGESISRYIGSYDTNLVNVYINNQLISNNEYSYIDGMITINNVVGDILIKGPQTFMMIMKKEATTDQNIDFSAVPSAGIHIRSGTENDTYPIYYYRGAVTNNNVLFANFCWKVVRTTETGGTKIIYNGVPASDGSCNNTGTASQISTSSFNDEYNSPAHAGYMYGAVYPVTSVSLSEQAETYVYGNDITWDGMNYTLVDTVMSSSWTNDYKNLATKYHYTCFNTTGICTDIYYINYFGNESSVFYLTLSDGKDIETAKEEMFSNIADSTIKTEVDNWYATNMTGYTDSLEDTIWCDDRTITGGPLYSKDTNSTSYSSFDVYTRNVNSIAPILTCSNKLDSFTVSNQLGNQALTYPVGLLTADEYTLAGSGNKGSSTTSFLHTGQFQWAMSPYRFVDNYMSEFSLHSSGELGGGTVHYLRGVRPSVSLKLGTFVYGGDGSVKSPYIVY